MTATASNLPQPLNAKVLGYLSRDKPNAPLFALWNSVPKAYTECGVHPDIVEHLWDRINSKLPADCRGLVYGCPALVHPSRGVIFAIGMGTICGLRLPGLLGTEAVKDGAEIIKKFYEGCVLDIQSELGKDWYFGFIPQFGYRCADDAWCQLVYEMLDRNEPVD